MKKKDLKSGPRSAVPKAPKIKLRKPTRRDVVEIDTQKCLSMLRRIVRKSALPDVPHFPWGPFLN